MKFITYEDKIAYVNEDNKILASCIDSYIKKNDRSIRNLIENDIMGTLPDESKLDDLQMNRTYFVEGKCEEKVVKALQSQPQLIQDGRVYIVNVMQQKIKKDILRTLNKKSQIVFIYDTDTNNTDI